MKFTVKHKTNEIEPKDIYFVDENTGDNSGINQYLANQKLGQLEDIEDELGIDLITLFKALKNGIWIYDTNGIGMPTYIFKKGLSFNYCKQPSIQYYDRLFYLEDYGKTWVLTKEELL